MIDVSEATAADRPLCHSIRRVVFIEGQGVPEALEVDGRDGAATHFLARVDGVAVGTARARVVGTAAKAERVAVLPTHQGLGLGRRLMDALEAWARAQGLSAVSLHAQAPVIPFYEHLGYTGHGPRFTEAGLEHLAMTKPL